MPSKKRYNLTEPLSIHGEQFNKVMTTGVGGNWGDLTPQPIKDPFTYRRQEYRWVALGRFLTDSSFDLAPGDMAMYHPTLGIKMLTDPEQTVGLVTDIAYAPFGLSAPFFEGNEDVLPVPARQLLQPVSFDIYFGDVTIDDADSEPLVRYGRLGSADEFTAMARAAGHGIIAAAEVLQDCTPEQVEAWYKPQGAAQ